MEITVLIKPILFLIFLFGSAFFSAAETAFTAINRIKLRHLVDQRIMGAKRLEKVFQNPKQLITAILLGNNLANVACSALATTILIAYLQKVGINTITSMALITLSITTVLLIFGEITPKTLALKHPEKFAISFSKSIGWFIFIFKPIILIFEMISIGLGKLLQLSKEDDKQLLTIEEIKTMINVGSEEGVLEKEKNELLNNVFDFSETVVREIMTPRTDTICISVNNTIKDAIHLILEKGHSRIPVFEDKIDNILGVIYAKDLLSVANSDTKDSIRKFMRKAIFIPESKNGWDLLEQMKRAKFHMAIVVDEYGGMAGIVTMEDIIEEIVGEIHDEFDDNEGDLITPLKNGGYLVDASINIKDLSDYINHPLQEDDDYDTLGGFVLSQMGKFPAKGESIVFDSLTITVKEISKRRINKLELIINSENPNNETN